MAREVTVKMEAKYWDVLSDQLQRHGRDFMFRLLGNGAKYTHNVVAMKYVKLGPAISSMTRSLRRADGISSNRAGDASGSLSKAVGPANKGSVRGSTISGGIGGPGRDYIKFTRDGFRGGENLPEYTSYLEKGWKQKFTKKQAAFLTYKIMAARGETEFNYGLWMGLMKNEHSAPPRPFNYLTESEINELARVTLNSFYRIAQNPIT